MSDSDDGTNDGQLPSLSTGRRTVMGALAAGAGLGAIGSAAAQDDGDDQGDDAGDDDDAQTGGPVLSAALAASEHGVFSEAHGAFNAMQTEEGWAWLLHLEDVECVTQAHIHEGNSCESGPVVVPIVLYTETPAGDTEGAQENLRHATMDSPIAEAGVLSPGDENAPDEATLQDVAENPSDYYVNVHTTHHPDGEIRGQLRGVGGGDGDVDGPDMPDGGPNGNGTDGDDGMGGNETDDGMGGNGTDDDGTGGNETDDDTDDGT